MFVVNFNRCKNGNFWMKIVTFLLIFAQNIDRGYTLELPHLGEFQQYMFRQKYLCKSPFYYINVGCTGVYHTRTCYNDDH